MVAYVLMGRSGCLVVGKQVRGKDMQGTYQVSGCQPSWSIYRFLYFC